MRMTKCPDHHLVAHSKHGHSCTARIIKMRPVEEVRELLFNDQIFSADSLFLKPSTLAISSHYALVYARFNYKSVTLLLLFPITSALWRERSHAKTRWGSGVNQSREQRRLRRMRKRQIEDESCKGNKQQLGQMKRGGNRCKRKHKSGCKFINQNFKSDKLEMTAARLSNQIMAQQSGEPPGAWSQKQEQLIANSFLGTVCVYARMSVSVCAITAACKQSSSPPITAARLFPACPP